jgi:hypothetical protein
MIMQNTCLTPKHSLQATCQRTISALPNPSASTKNLSGTGFKQLRNDKPSLAFLIILILVLSLFSTSAAWAQSGRSTICTPGAQNETYTSGLIAGATYTWSIPGR